MRKHSAKHAEKKLSLTKRALALCLAMIFVCSCLLPAFANGTDELSAPDAAVEADGGDPEDPVELYEDPVTEEEPIVEEEPISDENLNEDEPMDEDDGLSTMDETPDEPATDEGGISLPIAGGDSGISLPVAGGGIVTGGDESESSDDTPKGPTITTDADGNIVYIYDTDDTTIDENPVISRPDGDHALDQVDAGFSIPTNIYHFWLKEMNSYDLAEVRTDAAAADMTVEQYLALHGKDKGCYHIMTAADGANLEDYRFTNPSSTDDPEGDSRTFAGWYTVDEFGEKHDFSFDETVYATEGKTIEVFAKWKESARTVTADAEISAMDVTVQVDGLAGARSLKVSALDRYDEDALMETLNEKYAGSTIVAHTFELAPLDKNNDELEPESGKKATVTIKGLGLESMENVKVYHKTNLELEDLTSTASVDADGNITFKTESFSPFAVVTVKKQEKYEGWYKELVNCSNEAMLKSLATEYFADKDFYTYLGTLQIEKQKVLWEKLTLEIRDNESSDPYGVALLSITGEKEVVVGNSITLTSDLGNNTYYTARHEWSWKPKDSSGKVTLSSSGWYSTNQAIVTGVAEGEVTITHKVTYYDRKGDESGSETETYEVMVKPKSYDGTEYNLYIYTLVPNQDDIAYVGHMENKAWSGMTIGKIKNVPAPDEATVIDGDLNSRVYTGTNMEDMISNTNNYGAKIEINDSQYPVIPILNEAYKEGSGLPKYLDYYYYKDTNKPENALTYHISWMEVVQSNGANTGRNGTDGREAWDAWDEFNKYSNGKYSSPISSVPYGTITYHLNGRIVLDNMINVSFQVEDAGTNYFVDETQFDCVYPKKTEGVLLKGIKRPDTHSVGNNGFVNTPKYPQSKTVKKDGKEYAYVFDGWYRNDPQFNEANKVKDWDTEIVTEDTVYYAHYVMNTLDIVITKQVKGLFGEYTHEFTFTVSGVNDTFQLCHGQSTEEKNVPINASLRDVLTITEKDAKGYKTSAVITDSSGKVMDAISPAESTSNEESEEKVINITIEDSMVAADGKIHITVINEKDGPVDNGVLLDTLPYLVILGIAAAGAIVLVARKRKHDDE